MKLIGLDIGTSFIKGAVLDLDRLRLLHVRRVPFPEAIPGLPPLYREFDPRHIIEAVRSLLAGLLPLADPCAGIVMCSQMHGVVLMDGAGRARSNFCTWQDQRVLLPHPSGTGSYFDVLRRRLEPESVRRLGNELRPGLPVGTLFWYAEQETIERGLIPAALPDFVIATLCGTTPQTELTNAAAHGLLDLEHGAWHEGALSALGLDRFAMPPLRRHGAIAGTLDIAGRGVPFYTPVGDYQCALLGALLQPGELSLNISTGSQVSLLMPQLVFGDFQTRPYFDTQFTATITHLPAGRALNALVGLLSELAVAHGHDLSDPWPYIIEAANAASAGELQVELAFYSSAVGDYGAITHLREPEMTVGPLFRAAFDSMARNYHACALRLSPEQAWNKLVFSGGLAQKIPLLREMIAEAFDAPYRLSPHSEDTLTGLMALGLAFTGHAASISDAAGMLRDAFAVGE